MKERTAIFFTLMVAGGSPSNAWSNGLTANASALRTESCFSQSECAQCLRVGCSYCVAGRELRTCFNVSRHPHLCDGKRGKRRATQIYTGTSQNLHNLPKACPDSAGKHHEHHEPPNVAQSAPSDCPRLSEEACQLAPCRKSHVFGDQRRCCTVGLLQWVRRQILSGFRRYDIILKALLAHTMLASSAPMAAQSSMLSSLPTPQREQMESAYLQLVRARLSSLVSYDAGVRLEMYAGLVESVQRRGFHWEAPLQVDADLLVVDGSHRAALALAMGESEVRVAVECATSKAHRAKRRADGPRQKQDLAYLANVAHLTPLVLNAINVTARRLLLEDVHEKSGHEQQLTPRLAERHTASGAEGRAAPVRFVAIMWGCARHLWPQMISEVRRITSTPTFGSGGLTSSCQLTPTSLATFVSGVYEVDDVAPANLQIKQRALARCPPSVLALNVTTTKPAWRQKANGRWLSATMEGLKKHVRGLFKRRVANYTHDILFHAADNYEVHSRHLDTLVAKASGNGGCGSAAIQPSPRSSAIQPSPGSSAISPSLGSSASAEASRDQVVLRSWRRSSYQRPDRRRT